MIVSARDLMPLIRAALERDQGVRMTATGSSMFPFICSGDVVELEPVRLTPGVGDLVLAQCPPAPDGERYVLHRVVRVEGGSFFLRGDSQKDCEGPFAGADILGRATVVYHNGHARRIDRGFWRAAGLAWNRCAPLNVWLFQAIHQFRKKGKQDSDGAAPESLSLPGEKRGADHRKLV